MNKLYRGEDFSTDILAFPYREGRLWGELVISVERVRENALKYKVDEREEFLRVFIHGLLHLEGERDDEEELRKKMEKRQEDLLREYLAEKGGGRKDWMSRL